VWVAAEAEPSLLYVLCGLEMMVAGQLLFSPGLPGTTPFLLKSLRLPGELDWNSAWALAAVMAALVDLPGVSPVLCFCSSKKNTKKLCLKCTVGLHNQCFNAFHGIH
jgi:hypothetical protein